LLYNNREKGLVNQVKKVRRFFDQKVRPMPKQSLLAMKVVFGARAQYAGTAFAISFLVIQLIGVVIFSGGVQAAINLDVTTGPPATATRTTLGATAYSNDLSRKITATYAYEYGLTSGYGSSTGAVTASTATIKKIGPRGSTPDGLLSGTSSYIRLALADDGSTYVTTGSSVKYYNSAGVYQGQWGSGGIGEGQFNLTRGIDVGAGGDVYVLDNYRVQRFTATGTHISTFGSYGSGDGDQLLYPLSLAVAPSGDVYVLDGHPNKRQIKHFTASGAFVEESQITSTVDELPMDINFGPDGNLYVLIRNTSSNSSNVLVLDVVNDLLVNSFTAAGISLGVNSIASDIHGAVYIGTEGTNQIKAYSSTGSLLRTFNSPTVPHDTLTVAYDFYVPGDLAMGADGVLYIRSETYGNLVAATHGVTAIQTQLSATLSGLTCGTEYHYRIKAVVGADTVYGDDQTATTAACQTFAITTNTLPDGMVGDAYSTTIETNGPGGVQFSLLYGSMPAGLTLDENTGEISGTPTISGNYSLLVVAEDLSGTGDSELKMFSLVVNEDVSFEIITTSLPSGVVDEVYSATIEDNSTNPTEYYIIGGSFPPGLSLATSGAITGTPTEVGSYTFTAQAEDSYYNAPKELTIEITSGEVLTPIAITTTSLPDGTVGEDYSFDIETDNESGVTFSISAGTLPSGISLTSSGTLAGTPTTAGTTSFTVLANNGSTTDTQVLELTVVDPEEPIDEPVIDGPLEEGPDISEVQQDAPLPTPPNVSAIASPSDPVAQTNSLFALAKRIPEPVAIGFPWLLLALALILVSIQYYQVHSESVATKKMQAVLANQERLVEEQNNFVALTTHYIHTPLTVMEGEISLMLKAGTISQETANKLRASLTSLSAGAEAVLAEEDTNE
jgi:hypothetical protein